MAIQINIAANGRMILPSGIRKKMGLYGDSVVYLEEGEGGIILRTAAQAVAQAQAIARRYASDDPDASVAAFLADRSEEADA